MKGKHDFSRDAHALTRMNVPFLDLRRQYEGIRGEVEKKMLEALASTSYIGGKYVSDLEGELGGYLGVKHAISCSSGTAALILALRACNVKPGDEIITSPFTFFATAEAIASIGAVPVFADICSDDYNIDARLIEEKITPKTKAILPVHIFGYPADMDVILDIAKRHKIKVIEDCAQAIGAEYKGSKAGSIGDIGCFSFYPTKNLGGCGDGGLITTNDDDLAIILRALKDHGAGENGLEARRLLGDYENDLVVTEETTDLYNPYRYYNYLIAYNSRLDALQAVYLSIKLKHLDEYNARRAEIAEKYIHKLSDKVRIPKYDATRKTCWHQFVICTDDKAGLCEYLSQNGVGNGSFYPVPLHKQKAFTYLKSINLPISEKICSETVCLPIFPELTDEEIEYVIEMVNKFCEEKK